MNRGAQAKKKPIIDSQLYTIYLSLLLLGIQGSTVFHHHFFTGAGECAGVIYRQLFSFPSALSPLECLLHLLVHLSGDRKLDLIIGNISLFTLSTCIVSVCRSTFYVSVPECVERDSMTLHEVTIHFYMLYWKVEF